MAMEPILRLVAERGFLTSSMAGILRQCDASLRRAGFLAEILISAHPLLPAYLASPEGPCTVSDEKEWLSVLCGVLSMRDSFAAASISLSAFCSPLRILGDGPMSTIDLYQHRASSRYVAIKCYAKESLIKYKKAHEAMAEKTAMLLLQEHTNVIKLFATFQSSDSLFFVLELCPFGDLIDVVRREPEKRLPLSQCRIILEQLVNVINYCHSKGLCHRDVKCENILIASDGSIRLSDFGTAHMMGSICEHPFVGSPQYIAPEVVNGAQPTEKVDYFGVGCVAFFIWTGSDAFLRGSDYLTWKAILEDSPSLENVPEVEGDAWIREFVTHTLEKNPDDRIMEIPAISH